MQILAQLLTPERTLCRASGSSKKKLFETLAELIARDRSELSQSEVFTQLVARERLGSTGLGGGIAIPHCRIPGCQEPLAALVSLEEPIDFDAPDDMAVDLLCVLLVPDQAHQEHLDILARIARLFSQGAFCEALRDADSNDKLFRAATEWADEG
ncbi:PTS sugar transporter subunit IIA [Haliea atlantica]